MAISRLSQCFLFVQILIGLLCSIHASSNYGKDPYRWILSRGKPVTQSSTDGNHVASYATDGDFNNHIPPLNYSRTLQSNQPYVQIDLGESSPVNWIQVTTPLLSGQPSTFSSIKVTVGDDPVVDSENNQMFFNGQLKERNVLISGKKGRYVTIQRMEENVIISLTEIAVHKRPIENIAYRKNTDHSSAFSSLYDSAKAVDSNENVAFASNTESKPWLRVDLADVYFIHEILFQTRNLCCDSNNPNVLDLRVGDDLKDNGNANPLCAHLSLYIGDMRSFYCDMFGRYVNVVRSGSDIGAITVGEIIVNPETTDNVAGLVTTYSNTASMPGTYQAKYVTDMRHSFCYFPQPIEHSKRIWIILGADYVIAMIHVVNNYDRLNDLVDFVVAVGMSSSYASSTPCVPGLQSMAGILSSSFFCEPRITGNHVFLYQERTDKQMSVCEVGVFEETKPKITDVRTDSRKWVEELTDLTLTCEGKGYPAPVLTWVKDNKILQSGSSTLQLNNVKPNETGNYECWANNTHGVDAKKFSISITSGLRVCTSTKEIKYQADNSNEAVISLRGNVWYKFFDPKAHRELEFFDATPIKHVSCLVWMNGAHPKVQDGVVSRKLCIRNETNDCSSTIEIFVRRCASQYTYNFKNLYSTAGLTFCFRNLIDTQGGFNPTLASPIKNHALSRKTFHTEMNVIYAYECLIMCHLEPRCKSFNYSKKLKLCELNSATKKQFPGNYGYSAHYDYHHTDGGVVKVARKEL